MLLGSLCTVALSATLVLGRALLPRTSPTACPQPYVCPEPRPYPDTADTGDDPGPGRFKCRIGRSVSDPNFAFCIYEKATGNLVGSTPSGIEGLCWERGMPNPACAGPATTKRGVPRRIPRGAEPAAPSVSMERFKRRSTPLVPVDYDSEDEDDEQEREV